MKYVIYSENEKEINIIKDVIKNINENADVLYFDDLDIFLINAINDTELKIYILYITEQSQQGLRIADAVREKDYESVIILINSHEMLAISIIKKNLMILSAISVFDDMVNKLRISLNKATQIIENKYLFKMRFNRNEIYINKKDILYIYYKDKYVYVVTFDKEFKTNESLKSIFERLDHNFEWLDRGCIINTSNTVCVNRVEKTVVFRGGKTINKKS